MKCVRSGGGLFSPRPLWPRLLEPGGPVLPGTMATIGPLRTSLAAHHIGRLFARSLDVCLGIEAALGER
jgi:hypothetical protein